MPLPRREVQSSCGEAGTGPLGPEPCPCSSGSDAQLAHHVRQLLLGGWLAMRERVLGDPLAERGLCLLRRTAASTSARLSDHVAQSRLTMALHCLIERG